MVFLIHTASTLLLTGLIWMVQVVHYPLMAQVGEAQFAGYESAHSRRISLLVIPLMISELVTGIWLFVLPSPWFSSAFSLTGLILLGLIWGSTFLLQVPQHRVLMSGFESRAHGRLVNFNWIRTAAWTGRSMLMLVALFKTF